MHVIVVPVLKYCFLRYCFVVIVHAIFVFKSFLRYQMRTFHRSFAWEVGNLRAKWLAVFIWNNSWLLLILILICYNHFLLFAIIISIITTIIVLVLISIYCLAYPLPIIRHARVHHLSVLWQRGAHSRNIVMIVRIHLLLIRPARYMRACSNSAWNLLSFSFHELVYSNGCLLYFFVRCHLRIPLTDINCSHSTLRHLHKWLLIIFWIFAIVLVVFHFILAVSSLYLSFIESLRCELWVSVTWRNDSSWQPRSLSFLTHSFFIRIDIPAVALYFVVNIGMSVLFWVLSFFKRTHRVLLLLFHILFFSLIPNSKCTLRLLVFWKCSFSVNWHNLAILDYGSLLRSWFNINLSFWGLLRREDHWLSKVRSRHLRRGRI